jgi:hypothetical protein
MHVGCFAQIDSPLLDWALGRQDDVFVVLHGVVLAVIWCSKTVSMY